MKIIPGASGFETASTSPVSDVSRVDPPSSVAQSAPAASEALQSTVLDSALDALSKLPDIDHERVALLRDALAKGELPFNAGKLAALIQSYHRSGGK